MIPLLIFLLSVSQPIRCLKMDDFQMEGAVVSLPWEEESGYISASKVKAAVNKAVGPEIHTWNNKMADYQLECRVSVTSPGRYSVRVLYSGAQLEAMEVTRFDGELTKSITIQSTNTTVHVVRYYLSDRTCVKRSYIASSDGKGFIKKQFPCSFPAPLWNVHKTKLRNNGWIWGTSNWENWGKTIPGLWKGAIASMPATSAAPDPSILTAFKIHSWSNVITGYYLTVYRVTKNSQTFHYIAIYYHMELLQSGVQITKFDDTLLNSVSLAKLSGPSDDQHEIQYKFHDGNCKDRLYSYVQEKAIKSKIHLDISEDDCQKFSSTKFWTSVNNIKAINGWLY